jgi:hypothetical protein
MKGAYENMKLLFKKIQYEKYNLEHLWGFNAHYSLAWLAAWLH